MRNAVMRPQEFILTTEQTQNPTASSSDGGASTPSDPLDRIQAFLDAGDGESTASDGEDASDTPDTPDSGEQGKTQEPQFTTTHLAQHLGLDESAIDVDEEGQPVFKTKIDGKESPVKFADLLKSYQLQGHAENRTREAVAKEQAAERRLQEADQAIQARFQQQQESLNQLNAINAILQEELKGEYQAYNWDELWQANPAQARAMERRFEQRQQRINAVGQQIQQKNAQAAQEAETQRSANAQRTMQAEAQRLKELIPDWSDRAVASKEQGELTEWAMGRGYDPRYINALHNAQVPNAAVVIRDLRNAWKHDTLQKSKPEIENRVRSAPKLIKPGATAPSDGGAANLKTLRANVRKATSSGSTKAFADLLLASGVAGKA